MTLTDNIKQTIDNKTKPLRSLGQLETLAEQICLVQETTQPSLSHPSVIVFAADHGLADSGVSAYPKEVTAQMVLNFVNRGAAINVFCQQHNLKLQVVDAGVDNDFDPSLAIIDKKIAHGTANCLRQKAMSTEELDKCFETGRSLVDNLHSEGCNIIGFGEMGIGNTSAAALIMHYVLGLPLNECVGRGTGLDDEGLNKKLAVLSSVTQFHGKLETPKKILEAVGGFEIAMMCGAILRAAENKMLVLVDGFIASSAALLAIKLNSHCRKNMIFCHQSEESGHAKMLNAMEAQPLLNLGLRLGEGSGCALAYPIVASAVHFINEMASFDSANVSQKSD